MIPYLISKDFDLEQLKDSNGKYLFDSNNLALLVQKEAPSIPSGFGLGVLGDTIYCHAKHELNGMDEIELRYPITGDLFGALELRAVIVAQVDRTRGNQPYRIYRITKPLNGVVTVYARHLVYDLAGIVVEPFTASDIQAALAGLTTHAMTTNPFTFSSTRSTAATFRVTVPSAVWSLMGGQQGSLLDVYGGEYLFDGYTVRLENRIGADNGASVRYGVNMTDLEQDANCADCYTGVVAYWQATEENGEVVYSPVVSAAGTYGYVKILSVDMSQRWESKPTPAQLSAAAASYITANQIGVPKVSWKVGFVPLDITEEYKDVAILERVGLGDTVGVHFDRLNVDASARVNAIEWDVLLGRYISVSLGSVKSNIADTIARQSQEIAQMPTTQDAEDIAARVSRVLTNAILGANGGSVRLLDTDGDGEPDTLYIADNPDPAQAIKVWRFNYEGWAASANGYNGPFTMGATLNDGLLADFITAGVLNAGLITAGTMSADRIYGGSLTLGGEDNKNGKLVINNMNGQPIAESDWMGISFYSGMANADKHLAFRIGRTGISVRYSPDELGGGSVFNISGGYTDPSNPAGGGYGTLGVYRSSGTNSEIMITMSGSDGLISCKRLIVNGHEIT